MTGRLPRQALPMLAAAGLLLPAIIVLAVWANSLFEQRRADVEREALAAAREMVALADAEAEANSRMLALIAASQSVREPPSERVARFFRLALAENPSWNGLVLREAASGRVLYQLGRGDGQEPAGNLPPAITRSPESGVVLPDGRYCPCVVFHKRVNVTPERIVSLYMAPDEFQAIMLRFVDGGAVGGLVARDGRFIARSIDYAKRVGTLGTGYVRRAVETGGEGFYRGRTFEGLENYTAYATSPRTGWSAHLAVASGRVDQPRSVANLSVIVAIIAALMLAAGLIFYAFQEARARQRDEKRFIALQKSEAISRFTSTVVHDFRNILGVIASGIELIDRHSSDDRVRGYSSGMGEAVERGNRLINQLLSFARGDTAEVGPVDLERLLSSCDQLFARSLGDGIRYRWSVAEEARWVHANADQLELALLNLAVNARDAMEGSGSFTIEAVREGDWVAISASDSGPGIPAALRERIFEAFYSTKGDGKGTGLGLAQVSGTAHHAGGRVELRNGPGGGANFVICLPREEGPPEDGG